MVLDFWIFDVEKETFLDWSTRHTPKGREASRLLQSRMHSVLLVVLLHGSWREPPLFDSGWCSAQIDLNLPFVFPWFSLRSQIHSLQQLLCTTLLGIGFQFYSIRIFQVDRHPGWAPQLISEIWQGLRNRLVNQFQKGANVRSNLGTVGPYPRMGLRKISQIHRWRIPAITSCSPQFLKSPWSLKVHSCWNVTVSDPQKILHALAPAWGKQWQQVITINTYNK